MATYAIGDIHGCYDTLQRLLRRIQLDVREDRLWLVGDLVNRGPRSLDVLRWAVDLGDYAVTVLGNHDLHLLGRALEVSPVKRRDTLDEVLDAPDRDDLFTWLRTRPLLHREDGHVLVHAGLFPDWTVEKAERLARETEAWLQGDDAPRLLEAVEKKAPERWQKGLEGFDRARVALSGFAKLRTLGTDGRMCADFSGPPQQAPKGCRPWFTHPERRSHGSRIVFGHWAALGLWLHDGVAGLDTGAAWGRELTGLRLDDGRVFQERTAENPNAKPRA